MQPFFAVFREFTQKQNYKKLIDKLIPFRLQSIIIKFLSHRSFVMDSRKCEINLMIDNSSLVNKANFALYFVLFYFYFYFARPIVRKSVLAL
jgi:hypothetical protein